MFVSQIRYNYGIAQPHKSEEIITRRVCGVGRSVAHDLCIAHFYDSVVSA